MALTSADIAQMRLQHLDQIMRRTEAVRRQITQLRLASILFIFFSTIGILMFKSPIGFIAAVAPVFFCITSLVDLHYEVGRLGDVYKASLDEGFEAVPDFGQLNSNGAGQPEAKYHSFIYWICLTISAVVVLSITINIGNYSG